MSTYHAPLAEMQFVMNELAGLEQVATLPGLRGRDARHGRGDPRRGGEVRDRTCSIRSTRPATAKARKRLEDGTVKTPAGFKDAYRQFCENGWNGLTKNPEYGGQGLPQLVAARGRGDVARVEHGVRPVPDADAGRDRGDRAARLATS